MHLSRIQTRGWKIGSTKLVINKSPELYRCHQKRDKRTALSTTDPKRKDESSVKVMCTEQKEENLIRTVSQHIGVSVVDAYNQCHNIRQLLNNPVHLVQKHTYISLFS